MLATVSRQWPDTTTFLMLIDPGNMKRLKAEMESASNASTKAQAKTKSNAF